MVPSSFSTGTVVQKILRILTEGWIAGLFFNPSFFRIASSRSFAAITAPGGVAALTADRRFEILIPAAFMFGLPPFFFAAAAAAAAIMGFFAVGAPPPPPERLGAPTVFAPVTAGIGANSSEPGISFSGQGGIPTLFTPGTSPAGASPVESSFPEYLTAPPLLAVVDESTMSSSIGFPFRVNSSWCCSFVICSRNFWTCSCKMLTSSEEAFSSARILALPPAWRAFSSFCCRSLIFFRCKPMMSSPELTWLSFSSSSLRKSRSSLRLW
mmetsp:Transcript_10991/g.19419  ORF Transcript_10991/g.19419 Transcript_10991/m.19419 type:complete len:268 (+) Transcript_10991:1521-2324(+)